MVRQRQRNLKKVIEKLRENVEIVFKKLGGLGRLENFFYGI